LELEQLDERRREAREVRDVGEEEPSGLVEAVVVAAVADRLRSKRAWWCIIIIRAEASFAPPPTIRWIDLQRRA
jgi:hypothetical protein